MEHIKLTFDKIMQPNILYFDEKMIAACKNICETLKIDTLPSIDGKHYYEREHNDYKKREILEEQKVSVDDRIFTDQNLKKFENNNHNVLYVFDQKSLCGVVHFSDFNKDVVLQNIQDDILSFERLLRKYLELKGKKNSDVLNFFYNRLSIYNQHEEKKKRFELKIKLFEKNRDEINSLHEFQSFEFSDLMEFAGSSFTKRLYKIPNYPILDKEEDGQEILRKLRNLAMHGKNPVEKNENSGIYNIGSLRKLFEYLNVLSEELARIKEFIRQDDKYIVAVELDNRKKLEIIHDHHPEALKYFIGW